MKHSTSIFCDKGTKECGKWKLQENTFPMQEDFPTVFDERPGAPKPPLQRVPTRDSTELETAILKCNWLKEAAFFAHHNLSTKNPVTGRSFWTMKSGTAFLRTCAMTGAHQKKVLDAVREGTKVMTVMTQALQRKRKMATQMGDHRRKGRGQIDDA